MSTELLFHFPRRFSPFYSLIDIVLRYDSDNQVFVISLGIVDRRLAGCRFIAIHIAETLNQNG